MLFYSQMAEQEDAQKHAEQHEHTEKKAEISAEDQLIEIRKEKIVAFFKKNNLFISLIVLAFIIYLAVQIRMLPVPGLKDVTTNDWTLGPDLDPFLFLRWAKDIVAHGILEEPDVMRYVPLGFHQEREYLLHPYMIAWFHKILGFFGMSDSVTYSAIIYPVFMFALTIIAFFLLTREIFVKVEGSKNANFIALIASFFLAVFPPLLPRTIAGIPEKESVGFLFIFLSIYLFIAAFRRNKSYSGLVFSALAGISTAAMMHIWGGKLYIFFTILPAVIVAFLFEQYDKKRMLSYFVWFGLTFFIALSIFYKYTVKNIITDQAGALTIFILFVFALDYLISNTKLGKYTEFNKLEKVPKKLIVVCFAVIISLVGALVFFGPSFVLSNLKSVYDTLIKPATSRLIQTVAENRQPYFGEWAGSFGPNFKGFLITFWLMIAGSIGLFYSSLKEFNRKDKTKLTLAFAFMLLALVFSRYSPDSLFNGENFASKAFLFGGIIVFVLVFGYYYFEYDNKGKEKLNKIDFGLLCFFFFYLLGIVSSRAAVRTIMVLVPSVSILIGYCIFKIYRYSKEVKDKNVKFAVLGLFAIVVLSAIYAGNSFYQESLATGKSYVPSVYTQQWQKAMAWVREETPKNAVFGHWWDYGYWLQSIGERATVLDGGNAISYWNHMMGRFALTGPNETEALEFLYAHNTTHFLIDSTDIGKYGAFSSIGSDAHYDRASFIPTFLRDTTYSQEKKNSTVFMYKAGVGLDEDIVYEENGSKIYIPTGSGNGLAAVLIERNSTAQIISAPIGIFVANGQQYSIPLRYLYDGKLRDFGKGLEAGVFLFPRVDQTQQGVGIERDGAMLYLSRRVVNSQLSRLYLYKKDDKYFKLAHSEDDIVVAQIKEQNPTFDSDFVYYQGLRGPIRIWEIKYPKDIKYDKKYISTEYPADILYA